MVNIGTKIKLLRILSGKKQVDFADLVDIAQSDLSQIESGRSSPTPNQVKKVEERLGISLDDPRIEQFITLRDTLEEPVAA